MEPSVKTALHQIIDEASDEKLQEIYDWIKEDLPKRYSYTDEDIKLFYDRLELHERDMSQSYSVQEAHELIRKHKP